MIIDGRVKIKSGSEIDHFTEEGLKMKDGDELKADVVVLCTGYAISDHNSGCRVTHSSVRSYGDIRGPVRDLLEPEVAKKITPIWDLNEEGELQSTWREIGVPNLWYHMGTHLLSSSSKNELSRSDRQLGHEPLLFQTSRTPYVGFALYLV